MANRNWRSSGYQSFNQILTPMSYYPQPVTYPTERKTYGGRGGYREDNYKRERKDFQSNRRERFSPNKRRSPYQRSHESHGNYRKDSKKSHGHYEVKAPRLTFDIKELSTSSLKFRYPKMYTPSDFFHTRLNVQEAFPLYRPMKLGNHCEFQVLSKDVETEQTDLLDLEPEDASYKYSAKVMLMTTPEISDLYKRSCHLPGETSNYGQNKYGLFKNIHFLVGAKGKNEPMAIGGPWSPSLDGADPEKDPQVLVKTAIRTCKALTGIDLSQCKKWYKFLDIHYYRPSERKVTTEEEVENKDAVKVEEVKDEPTIEVVTIYIPDVWSCVPTEKEWSDIKSKYEKKLYSLLNPVVIDEVIIDEPKDEVENKMEEIVEVIKTEEFKEKIEDSTEKMEDSTENITSTNVDLNQMKVTELRVELAARGLDTKGLKMQLVQRLQEAMDSDKKTSEEIPTATHEVKENTPEKVDIVLETKVEAPKIDFANQLPEKERKRLEKLYKMNDKPSILVHPNKNAKGGRFECVLMSLESLLEYRIDDQKEHTFEVSLFAEQFNEMLLRDAAFVVYKSLLDMPELIKESSEPEIKKVKVDLESGVRKSRIIADINLLFAFCVFDYENGGYLREHDLENILHCIGLNLSRSQVKKLLSKLPSKKGSIVYRDVVEREVVEGSPDDIASLRTAEPNMERLIELSHGNKAFFDELDTDSLCSRSGSLKLLDKLNVASGKVSEMSVQLTLLKDELSKINASSENASDVETHLRDNIKKVEEKLVVEREVHNKLAEVAKIYHDLLKSARDHMDISAKDINDRFDHERQVAADKAKEEADRVKAEADRIKAEEDRIKAEEDRIKAEEDRIKAEEDRIKAEEERIKAEKEKLDSTVIEESLAQDDGADVEDDVTMAETV